MISSPLINVVKRVHDYNPGESFGMGCKSVLFFLSGEYSMEYDVSIRDGIAELGIFEKGGDAWVSTKDISKLFEKDHKNVIAKIEKEILPHVVDNFDRLNFKPVKIKDAKGEDRKAYLLNRKSITMIIMSFTGKKAIQFKQAYIEAFEAMNTLITTRVLAKEGYKHQTSAICKMNPQARPIDYANEADMVNKIILGMTAKDFQAVNDCVNTRDAVVNSKLLDLNNAERLNGDLILSGMDKDTRIQVLKNRFQEGNNE